MNEKKVMGLLGLALRSGNLALGADIAQQAVRSKKAMAVLLDAGASENTRKKLTDSCTYYQIPLIMVSQGMLELATGKQGRKAAALLHSDISKEILKQAVVHEENECVEMNAGVQATNGEA